MAADDNGSAAFHAVEPLIHSVNPMIEITAKYQNDTVHCKDVELVGGLNSGLFARLVLAQNLTGIRRGEHVLLSVNDGDQDVEMRFVVNRFRLPRDGAGGWIEMTDDVVSNQEPFGLEIFASKDRVGPEDVIKSRVPLDKVPKCFSRMGFPVVTVSDVPLSRVLDDLCARCETFWWIDGDHLVIGNELPEVVNTIGTHIEETETGVWMRPQRWVPLASIVKSESESGLVTAIRVSGDPPVLEIHLGEAPKATRALSTRVWTLSASICSVDPFEVELPSGREGAQVSASSVLMVRDSPDFRERLPLSKGTKIRAEICRGGVSTELPIAYAWTPGDVSEVYEVTASEYLARFDRFSMHVRQEASITAQEAARITGGEIHLNEYQ